MPDPLIEPRVGGTQRPASGSGGVAPLVRLVVRRPRRIAIHAIDVSAPIVPLGRKPDGTMQTPDNWGDAGWYELGESGPAVFAGHIDSTSGPAVSYRVRELRRGNLDPHPACRRQRHPLPHGGPGALAKGGLPDAARVRQDSRCRAAARHRSGNFNPWIGHHVDNTIVYAARVPEPGCAARRRSV